MVLYESRDAESLAESLNGRSTGWCIAEKSTANGYLQMGDIYVFYSLDSQNNATIPRVTIRSENKEIAEVRGIRESQNLDERIAPVVKEKLAEFPNSKAYLEKLEDVERLAEIHEKTLRQEYLTDRDIVFLYEADHHRIDGFGMEKDPLIGEIIKSRMSPEEDANRIIKSLYSDFEHNPTFEEDLNLSWARAANCDTKLPKKIKGYLNLSGLASAEGLRLPEQICGDLDLECLASAKGLRLPDN